MAEHKNVADHLGAMVGKGIYDVRILEEFGKYGFTYDRSTDTLFYTINAKTGETRSSRVGARPLEKARDDITRDNALNDTHGFVNDNVPADILLVDAQDISRAVYRLLTGSNPPSLGYTDRGLGFKADVRAITKYLRRN